MEVIRDTQLNGILMLPLWDKFNLHRCNVRGCKEKQTTIFPTLISQPFALCEKHYQESKQKGKFNYTLDFN